MAYKTIEELEERIKFRRIVQWDSDKLVLDNGIVLKIECTEQDCCASAGGNFTNVELDAVITSVQITSSGSDTSGGETTNSAIVTIFNNRNIVAQADCYADDGNGGYYYSVCSIVVNEYENYKVVEA